jgi:hypothetical protein
MAAAPPRQAIPAADGWSRWLPLAGAGFGVLTLAGDLVIGDFPDEKTSAPAVVRYYASHHHQVAQGGQLMIFGTLFLGLFVAGLVLYARRSPGSAAVIAVGGAAMTAIEIVSGSTYLLLGNVSTDANLTRQALQSWHVAGAAFGSSVGTAVLLVGVALAGLVAKVLPRWIGGTALLLAIGIMVPGFGFLFSMLSLPWAVAVGIALTVRPVVDVTEPRLSQQ